MANRQIPHMQSLVRTCQDLREVADAGASGRSAEVLLLAALEQQLEERVSRRALIGLGGIWDSPGCQHRGALPWVAVATEHFC